MGLHLVAVADVKEGEVVQLSLFDTRRLITIKCDRLKGCCGSFAQSDWLVKRYRSDRSSLES